VPPRDPERLAEALLALLGSGRMRRALGEALRQRVDRVYSPDVAIRAQSDRTKRYDR
jgi:glycosyltransferase involved in cell wall biosynthesis